MSPLLDLGQVLKGHKSTYTIVKELHRAVDEAAVYLARQVEDIPSPPVPFLIPCTR